MTAEKTIEKMACKGCGAEKHQDDNETSYWLKLAEGRIEELERWALCAELSKDEQDELSALKRMLWLEVE